MPGPCRYSYPLAFLGLGAALGYLLWVGVSLETQKSASTPVAAQTIAVNLAQFMGLLSSSSTIVKQLRVLALDYSGAVGTLACAGFGVQVYALVLTPPMCALLMWMALRLKRWALRMCQPGRRLDASTESMDETDDGLPVSESDPATRDSQSTRASAQIFPPSRGDRGEDSLEEQARIKDQGTLLNACILLLIYTYLTVSQYAIAMLECREVYLPAEKRDVSLLILEPSIECWGKEHVGTAAGPALAALVVCVRLAPALFPPCPP